MGMFDNDLGKPFSDHYREGEAFTLQDAKVGPEIPTAFGNGRPAMLKIDGEWFSAFGAGLLGQVASMDAGDLPAKVVMIRVPTKREGQAMKRLVPANDHAAIAEAVSAGTHDDIPF